jgi:hypothetical protein
MGNECFDVVGTFQKIIVKVARFLQILQNPKIKMKKVPLTHLYASPLRTFKLLSLPLKNIFFAKKKSLVG